MATNRLDIQRLAYPVPGSGADTTYVPFLHSGERRSFLLGVYCRMYTDRRAASRVCAGAWHSILRIACGHGHGYVCARLRIDTRVPRPEAGSRRRPTVHNQRFHPQFDDPAGICRRRIRPERRRVLRAGSGCFTVTNILVGGSSGMGRKTVLHAQDRWGFPERLWVPSRCVQEEISD